MQEAAVFLGQRTLKSVIVFEFTPSFIDVPRGNIKVPEDELDWCRHKSLSFSTFVSNVENVKVWFVGRNVDVLRF